MSPIARLLPLAACALALVAATHAQAQPRDLLPSIPRGNIALNLLPVATGLGAPDFAAVAPGDPSRLYVVEQGGQLRVLLNGVLQPGNALDISSRLTGSFVPTNANDERGLLGLAFHPDFANPAAAGFRTLYTFNSEPIPVGTTPTYQIPNLGAPGNTQNYKTVVNEWKMPTLGVVDPASRREVISFGKNAGNHNGGTILFGRDGYMYLALGDGGNANDVGPSHIEPGGNAQNPTTPLGKMLRFDPLNPALTTGSANPVSANGQYRVPVDNMGAGGPVPEQYALGFRNPYRFSVDRLNGQIIVADVGQNNVEEINRLQAGGNYGWAIKEGDFLFNRVAGPGGVLAGTVGERRPELPGSDLIDPLSGPLGTLEYDHQDGISITGGFVYRGDDIPALFGKYVFGDLAIRNGPRVDGRLFYADLESGLISEFVLPAFVTAAKPNGGLPNSLTVHGFGEDAEGELYALVTNTAASGTGGIVYKLTLAPIPEPATWALWSAGGLLLMARLRRRRA